MHSQGSRRRLRPDVAAALDNIASIRKAQKEHSVKSRTKGCMTSKSRRRPPHEPPLVLTPSTVWGSLPMSIRIILLLAGFLSLYYFLFARHQRHDRTSKKIKEIHRELEQILKKANESGFMGQNLVEAVLPDIFRDADESSSKSNGTRFESSTETEEKNPEDSAKAPESESDSAQDEQLEPKKKKPKKKRRKKRKKKKDSSAKSKQDAPPANVGSSNHTSGADRIHSNIANASQSDGRSSELPAQSINEPMVKTKMETSMPHSSIPPPSNKSDTADKNLNTNTTSPVSEETSSTAVSETNDKTDIQDPNTASTFSREAPSTSTKTDLAPEFAELETLDIPKSSIPILNWNIEAVMNESIPEQIFNLGESHDHVFMYKPLCLDTSAGEGIIFEGTSACAGFNRTEPWLKQYCSDETAVQKEHLLTVKPERKSKKWLADNSEFIHWVTGLTVLQVLERNCGNIAHFAGRALLLQHIIENVGSYAAPPSEIANILIMPSFHTMKRFLYPQNYDHWHTSLIKSLLAPASLEIGDLGSFLDRTSKGQKPKEPLVQLLHNFSSANSQFAAKRYVCFKRALIPGYLKGRFFVDDIEYPSTKPSLQYDAEDTPTVPRDSLRLRERVSALINQTPELSRRRKEIVLIDRRGSRRIFDEAKKPVLMKAFKDIAVKHGYSFEVISFEKKSFDEQYNAVKSASIAIGIHGANLVNTIFMPPLAVLIEVFPYGFAHKMYRDGGNAGLKYYSYQMSTGERFKGLQKYKSPEHCVRWNKDCKVHYRDATLQVTETDTSSMTQILEQAIQWCEKLPAPLKQAEESAKTRRRSLR